MLKKQGLKFKVRIGRVTRARTSEAEPDCSGPD